RPTEGNVSTLTAPRPGRLGSGVPGSAAFVARSTVETVATRPSSRTPDNSRRERGAAERPRSGLSAAPLGAMVLCAALTACAGPEPMPLDPPPVEAKARPALAIAPLVRLDRASADRPTW